MSMEIDGPFLNVERGSEKAADFMYVGGKNALTGIGTEEEQEVWNMGARNLQRNRVTGRSVPSNPEVLFTHSKTGYSFEPIEDGSGLAYAYMTEGGPLCVDVQNLEVVYDLPRPTGSDGYAYSGGYSGLLHDGRWYLSNDWYNTAEEELVLNAEDGSVHAWWNKADITYSYAGSPLPMDGNIIYETQNSNYDTKAVAVDPSDGSVQWSLDATDGLRSYGFPDYLWAFDPGTGLLVTVDDYGGIHKVDPADGTLVESTEQAADFWNICVANGVAYGVSAAAIAAIDIADGTVMWEVNPPTDDTPPRPAYHDGVLYFAPRDWGSSNVDSVVALDATDGSEIWRAGVLDYGTWTGGEVLYSIPDDIVISPTDDTNMLYALDGSDGSTVWSLQVNSNRGFCTPVGERLVTASGNFDVVGDP